jgi:hypothetical protein
MVALAADYGRKNAATSSQERHQGYASAGQTERPFRLG